MRKRKKTYKKPCINIDFGSSTYVTFGGCTQLYGHDVVHSSLRPRPGVVALVVCAGITV